VDGYSTVLEEHVRCPFPQLSEAWAYLIVAVWLAACTLFLALSLPKENLEHHFRFTGSALT